MMLMVVQDGEALTGVVHPDAASARAEAAEWVRQAHASHAGEVQRVQERLGRRATTPGFGAWVLQHRLEPLEVVDLDEGWTPELHDAQTGAPHPTGAA